MVSSNNAMMLPRSPYKKDMPLDRAEDTITLGIVVFNTAIEIIERTIQSCHAIDFPGLRVIVLCNSNDSLYQKSISDLCAKYQVYCLSNQPNQGFGHGHNVIARTYAATWYICCNPDIEITIGAIDKLIEFARSKPDSVMVMPKILSPEGVVQPLCRKHLTPLNWLHRQAWRLMPYIFSPYEVKFDYSKSSSVDFVSGCFFLIRMKLFLQLQGFDESFFLYVEDADLSFRASRIGTNYYCSEATVVHKWSTNWWSNPKALNCEISSLARFFWKRILSLY